MKEHEIHHTVFGVIAENVTTSCVSITSASKFEPEEGGRKFD
jgi:hypothetical protein